MTTTEPLTAGHVFYCHCRDCETTATALRMKPELTVYDLAREIDQRDPARGVDNIIDFLSHRTGLSSSSVLDVLDVEQVRACRYWPHYVIDEA